MPHTSIYSQPSPPTWQQWLLSVGLAFAALFALRYHIYYLNHLRVSDWDWRYLMVNRDNGNFLQKLRRIKMVISALWLASFALGLYYCWHRLVQQGKEPDRKLFRRMALALFAFLFTVVNYNPPDIDLSLYFFNNSLVIGLMSYGLYRMPYTRLVFMLLGRLAMTARRIPNWVLAGVMALFVFFMAHMLGANFFSHMPLTVDTSAQLVHAKIMLQGDWSIPSHPLRNFFNMYMMVNNGRWYSQYPPGHVMLLALGTYLKSRAWVNPMLGALTVLATYGLAKEMYGIRVARLAVVMAGACVYLIMMSSEFMSNATSLLCATVFLFGYFRLLNKPHWQTGLWTGAAIGYCFITRPYSCLALALPYIIYAVYLLSAEPKRYGRPLMALVSAGMAFVLFQLYYNFATTGNPFVFGYQMAWGEWHNPLTPEAASRLSGGELEKNLRENLQRTGWFNRLVFEWPIPSLILLALLYGWRGAKRNEKLAFFTFLSFLASCAVLPGNVEREWGPRLCFETLTLIVVLSAKGLSMLPAFFRIICKQRRGLSYYYGFAVVLACIFYSFSYMHNLQQGVLANIYNFYGRGNNPSFYKYVVGQVETPAVVFVTGQTYEAVDFTNPPMDNSPIIFAQDLGYANNGKLMDFYPERNIYHAMVFRQGFRVDKWRGIRSTSKDGKGDEDTGAEEHSGEETDEDSDDDKVKDAAPAKAPTDTDDAGGTHTTPPHDKHGAHDDE